MNALAECRCVICSIGLWWKSHSHESIFVRVAKMLVCESFNWLNHLYKRAYGQRAKRTNYNSSEWCSFANYWWQFKVHRNKTDEHWTEAKASEWKKLLQTSAYEWSQCIPNTLLIAITLYRTRPTHIWRWIIPSSIISFWCDVAKAKTKRKKLLVSDIGSWHTSLFSVTFGRSTFLERRQDENLVWPRHKHAHSWQSLRRSISFLLLHFAADAVANAAATLPLRPLIKCFQSILCRLPLIEIRYGTCALCAYTGTMLRVRAHCLRNRSKCLFMLHLLAIHVFPFSVQFSFLVHTHNLDNANESSSISEPK